MFQHHSPSKHTNSRFTSLESNSIWWNRLDLCARLLLCRLLKGIQLAMPRVGCAMGCTVSRLVQKSSAKWRGRMGGGDLTPKHLVFHGFPAKVDTLHRTLCRSLPKCWIFTLRSSWCAWHRPSKSRFRRHLSHLTKCGRVKYSHEATTLPGSSVSKAIRLACCVV